MPLSAAVSAILSPPGWEPEDCAPNVSDALAGDGIIPGTSGAGRVFHLSLAGRKASSPFPPIASVSVLVARPAPLLHILVLMTGAYPPSRRPAVGPRPPGSRPRPSGGPGAHRHPSQYQPRKRRGGRLASFPDEVRARVRARWGWSVWRGVFAHIARARGRAGWGCCVRKKAEGPGRRQNSVNTHLMRTPPGASDSRAMSSSQTSTTSRVRPS